VVTQGRQVQNRTFGGLKQIPIVFNDYQDTTASSSARRFYYKLEMTLSYPVKSGYTAKTLYSCIRLRNGYPVLGTQSLRKDFIIHKFIAAPAIQSEEELDVSPIDS